MRVYRDPGESQEVWTLARDAASEERSEDQRSEESKIKRRDTSLPPAWRSSSSETKVKLNCSSWTTELTAARLPKTSQPLRGMWLHHFDFLCAQSINHLYSFNHSHLMPSLCHRLAIVKRAKELNVRLTNGQAKLRKVSAEWAASQPLSGPHKQARILAWAWTRCCYSDEYFLQPKTYRQTRQLFLNNLCFANGSLGLRINLVLFSLFRLLLFPSLSIVAISFIIIVKSI